MDGCLNISSKLEKTNLSKHRVFHNKIINNVVNMLFDMCKPKCMLILNGRCGDFKLNGYRSGILLIQLCHFNHYNL